MTIRTYTIGVPFKTVLSLRFDVNATSALTAINKVSDMIDARSKHPGADSLNDGDLVRGHGLSRRQELIKEYGEELDLIDGHIHPLDFISNFGVYKGEFTPEEYCDGFDARYNYAWIYELDWLKPPNAEIPNIDLEDDELRVYLIQEWDRDKLTKPDPLIPDLVTGLLNSN